MFELLLTRAVQILLSSCCCFNVLFITTVRGQSGEAPRTESQLANDAGSLFGSLLYIFLAAFVGVVLSAIVVICWVTDLTKAWKKYMVWNYS